MVQLMTIPTLAADARRILAACNSFKTIDDIAGSLQDVSSTADEFREMIANANYPPHTLREIEAKCRVLMAMICEAVIDGPVGAQ